MAELVKMQGTFIVPLLHPFSTPKPSLTKFEYDDTSQFKNFVESRDHLPIASRFLSSHAAGSDDSDEPEDDSEGVNSGAGTTSHASRQRGQGNPNFTPELDPRSPLASRIRRDSFGSLSRSSLSPRPDPNAVSAAFLGLKPSAEPSLTENDLDRGLKSILLNPSAREMQQKSNKSFTEPDLLADDRVAPHQIPDDLRRCLEVIEDILPYHIKLRDSLRKRYDEQYPFVRSLADVFVYNVRLLIPLFQCPDHRLTLVALV